MMPKRLSGGQAHRVALGRLLLAPCDALLLDEPYTGLDAALRRTLTDLVVSLVAMRNIPALLVAHELVEAQAFADRLAVLDRGRILQVGPPGEVVRRPASRRVAELVGYPRVRARQRTIPVGRRQRQPVNSSVASPLGASPLGASPVSASPLSDGSGGEGGTAVTGPTAGVHPERVVGGAHPERGLVLAGVVTACRPAGGGWEADLFTEGTTIGCRLPDKPVEVGDSFIVTALDPPYFGADGAATEAQSVAVRPFGSTSVANHER